MGTELLSQVHLVEDSYEYESSGHNIPQVKGNLKNNLQFWKTIGASRYILDVVEHGYRLPFAHVPPEPIWLKNNKSAFVHRKFVHEAIEELLQSDRVIEVQKTPLVINPLYV